MSRAEPTAIDPRGPRFSAAITAALLLVDVVLGLAGAELAAWLLLAALALLFAWGAFAGVARHPFGLLYRRLVRPRLAPPAELEDPRPPTFAQGVGLLVAGTGVVLGALGLPLAVPIAAAAAFLAAFLNAAFGFCLGCQLYLLLIRARVIRPARPLAGSLR
ncbi:DUF4395 domain-containing protein [Agromyces mediolanus]|uniref:DUF4395 domain-containing protein n=1 Tax=Agromyces mediolanus TaxID=41986 RepID=A0A918CNA7_AGRME|nr:DUF4395 domain-containing protein [Agromyces mediolanus]GGR32717.1 hypothetical protein GCM10010196_28390 [Agromyces mediolanus]GLJ74369.1 hypothetical protein GCM10017583_36280 [Agromyces mediolanus]